MSESVLERAALHGVRAKPVPQEALLRALLAQNGHYVASEVVELMELAGVAPISGYGIVVEEAAPDRAVMHAFLVDDGKRTPPFSVRGIDTKVAVLWSDSGQPAAFQAACAVAAEEPATLDHLAKACAHAGYDDGEESQVLPEHRRVYFSWGTASPTMKWYANKKSGTGEWRRAPEPAIEHHLDLLRRGRIPGMIALVVGRLLNAGHEIFEVGEARWLVELREQSR